jgi:hypothetical protein
MGFRMKTCKICGVNNEDNASFCITCGVKIENENSDIKNDNINLPAKKPIKLKIEKTFNDKKAIVSIILSSIGLFCVIALPAQIMGLLFGIGGLKSKLFKPLAIIGIIFSSISLIISGYIIVFIFNNLNNILDTNFFNAFYDSYKAFLG